VIGKVVLENSRDGIGVANSNSTVISDNLIRGNGAPNVGLGISLRASDYNTITGNIVAANTMCGITGIATSGLAADNNVF
jgi:parallel beta-helix repeat protein